jgi:nucleotide-binding universal stress UspA family protein
VEARALRVIVAIDGSGPAGIALDLASDLAWPAGTQLVVTEVTEAPVALSGIAWPAVAIGQLDQIEMDIRAEARRTVDAARGRLERQGLSVEADVLRGRPASAIVNRARDLGADLIIVGSRGRGTIASMLLGSVSAEVVDHAPVPVMVARASRVQRIVLAWDGSSSARQAADLLRRWPMFAGSQVLVVSVADTDIPWWSGFPAGSPDMMPIYGEAAEAFREQQAKMAKDMTAELEGLGYRAAAEPREGDAATEILAAAREWNADVIVMGTHGRTGLARVVLGSVARNVVQHATCSVLVVRGVPSPAA